MRGLLERLSVCNAVDAVSMDMCETFRGAVQYDDEQWREHGTSPTTTYHEVMSGI